MRTTTRRSRSKGIRVRGFVRGALYDAKTGALISMGDWHENAITADGFQYYIVGSVGAIGGASRAAAYMQLASQTDTPTSSQTSATGEFTGTDGARKSTTNTFVANGTLRMTASWATNEGNQSNVGAVAIYNTTSGGSCASVATFATSAKTTNQTLNLTYDYRFS